MSEHPEIVALAKSLCCPGGCGHPSDGCYSDAWHPRARAAFHHVIEVLDARIDAGHATTGSGYGFRVIGPRKFLAAAKRDFGLEDSDG